MFELTKPQKDIQKAAKDFAKGEFDKELANELERNGEFPEKIWKKSADLGFIGIHFPEEYTGGGLGLLENVLVTEEFCRRDSSIGSALTLAGFGSECVWRFGSNELKEKFLPRVMEGEILSSCAYGETEFGSDTSGISTTAEEIGGEWVINGEKKHVINGGTAGFYVVLCRTDHDTDPENHKTSMILVEADQPGLSAKDSGKKLGGNMISTATIYFDNLRVPVSNLVGKKHQGRAQISSFLNEIRILQASQALGTAQGAFDRVLDYSKERVQFDRKIVEFQVTRHKLADMATKIELARLITYKAAAGYEKGIADGKLASMAKMTAARTAMEIGAQTIQLFGGYGYMTEYEVERFYRDAKVIEIRDGARDTQKDLIANAVIGRLK